MKQCHSLIHSFTNNHVKWWFPTTSDSLILSQDASLFMFKMTSLVFMFVFMFFAYCQCEPYNTFLFCRAFRASSTMNLEVVSSLTDGRSFFWMIFRGQKTSKDHLVTPCGSPGFQLGKILPDISKILKGSTFIKYHKQHSKISPGGQIHLVSQLFKKKNNS